MSQLTLIDITNEHNNWLTTLEDKKKLIERTTKQLHFAPEGETTVVTVNSFQSRIISNTEVIDKLWNEINDNLLHIARQAEENEGKMTEAMIQQHETMKLKFLSADGGLQAFCDELSNINLN
jgi:hypothetical protein